jgi:hypothetical protein
MNQRDLAWLMEFARKKTDELIAAIEKEPDPQKMLGWRPGPGRAHIAWQLMHVGATDDRHLNFRMTDGKIVREDYVKRFGGGSTVDDDIPPLAEIRRYLSERRAAILAHLAALPDAALTTKPKPDAMWAYDEWYRLLAWHEGHHHGQAHLTLNLYKAAK